MKRQVCNSKAYEWILSQISGGVRVEPGTVLWDRGQVVPLMQARKALVKGVGCSK